MPEFAQWDLGRHLRELFRTAQCAHGRRENVAGFDAVHGDVLAPVLECRRADQPIETALGSGVVRSARHGDVRSCDRGGEYKSAAALFAQMRQGLLDEPESRL